MWKDETSYSRSDKERVPRVWELNDGLLLLCVHRWHGLDGWFMTLRFDGAQMIEKRELKADDIEAAKVEALDHTRTKLRWAITEMKKSIDFMANVI